MPYFCSRAGKGRIEVFPLTDIWGAVTIVIKQYLYTEEIHRDGEVI